MTKIVTEKKTEVGLILDQLESKIRKNLKQTAINERDDLSQEMKMKMIEKIDVLLDEEELGFIEFTKELFE